MSLWVVYLQDASLGCYQCAACLQFPSTDTVLVQVVVVHLNDVEGGIGVVFPATAQVYNIVYTTYLEVTREGQTQSIVFTIGGIGYMDFAQYGSIECSGSAQTVDAQCVVAAVLRSPFFVVDYARRYGVFVDVRKHVCTYNHGALLLVEGCNHLGQGVLIGIYVIAVQLHGKFAALGMLYTCIPATADAQIIALRHDVYQTWVVLELVDSLGGTVCRVVVNDDEVEGEVGLLGQDAAYSIADSTNAVAHGG